ncbi:hypothetical protein, partial [Lunatimonas salinarum]|uniref:hypothetical protein n=1 Tax=Lunatimonas salinarum TaxID=1774590 RepID=UPI001ADEF6AD
AWRFPRIKYLFRLNTDESSGEVSDLKPKQSHCSGGDCFVVPPRNDEAGFSPSLRGLEIPEN